MNKKTTDSIELQPDAWQRFERAIDVVAKSPPQHRVKKRSGKKNRSLKVAVVRKSPAKRK